MSFRRRSYPEVLDNLLTATLGGVSAEVHPFPPPGANGVASHALQKPPVRNVVSVYGARNGESVRFAAGSDYELDADRQTLRWLDGGITPDDGSVFHVNYLPGAAASAVNDVHVGSVARTLTESIGLEIARLYAELEAVYDAGFIDTASDRSLDKVVDLLGVERVRAGRFSGEVEFARAPGSRGEITLPAGTRVISGDGNVEYETTADVTMLAAQTSVRVVARDVEDNSEGVAAGTLNVLAKPVAGIAAVTNPAPTSVASADESDEELRSRAKRFLNGSERATVGALSNAISRQQVLADVEEPADRPGEVDVTVHADVISPELAQRLETAILDARPAGIKVNLNAVQAPSRIDLSLRLTTAAGLLEQDLRAAQDAVREGVAAYFAKLPVKESGSINRIVSLVLGVDGVEDVHIVSAALAPGATDVLDRETGRFAITGVPTVLGELAIVDTNLPSLLQVVVGYPDTEPPPSASELNAALNDTLAYLNALNASELPPAPAPEELERRTLSYGRLLYSLPLPAGGQPLGSLADFDEPAGPPPAPLPDETDIAPYTVEFVITSASGVSRVLSGAASTAYALAPFERLSLAGVELVGA